MTHIDNIREIEKIEDGYIKANVRKWYLRALKETEKEVEELKDSKEKIKENVGYKANNLDYNVGMEHGFEAAMKLLDKIFTHKEAIKEAEK